MPRLFKALKNYFITGLLVLLPLIVPFYVMVIAFRFLDGLLGNLIRHYLKFPVPGIGLAVIILLVIVTGVIARNVAGKKVIDLAEHFFLRIPLVKTVHSLVKQVIDSVSHGGEAFQKVVLVEYPRLGAYAIGLITGGGDSLFQDHQNRVLIPVFVPVTPNASAGRVILFPREDIKYLDLTVEEALKMIVSAGVVTPDRRTGEGGGAAQCVK